MIALMSRRAAAAMGAPAASRPGHPHTPARHKHKTQQGVGTYPFGPSCPLCNAYETNANTKRTGGLYGGFYSVNAALRYEQFWVPLVKREAANSFYDATHLPPLDIAYAWSVSESARGGGGRAYGLGVLAVERLFGLAPSAQRLHGGVIRTCSNGASTSGAHAMHAHTRIHAGSRTGTCPTPTTRRSSTRWGRTTRGRASTSSLGMRCPSTRSTSRWAGIWGSTTGQEVGVGGRLRCRA